MPHWIGIQKDGSHSISCRLVDVSYMFLDQIKKNRIIGFYCMVDPFLLFEPGRQVLETPETSHGQGQKIHAKSEKENFSVLTN